MTKPLAIIDAMPLLSSATNNDKSFKIETVLSISTSEKHFENEALLKENNRLRKNLRTLKSNDVLGQTWIKDYTICIYFEVLTLKIISNNGMSFL